MLIEGEITARDVRLAVITSRFNHSIVDRLLSGALACVENFGGNRDLVTIVKVPGAFETPLAALKAAETKRFDAVICLGAVIRGNTPHFEYVSGAATQGISQASLTSGIPIIFGILTTNTLEDAVERVSAEKEGNKGWEAAAAALEMVSVLKKLR